MKKATLLTAILLYALGCWAQVGVRTQWEKANQTTNDTARLLAYTHFLDQFKDANIAETQAYFPKIVELATRVRVDTLQYRIYNTIGILNFYAARYPDAMDFFSRALKISLRTHNKNYELRSRYNIAFIYYSTGNYEQMMATMRQLIAEYQTRHACVSRPTHS